MGIFKRKRKKTIIIARLLGGLGNQLFIYAYVRYLQMHVKNDSEIWLDTTSYKHNKFNSIDILKLPISRLFRICNSKALVSRILILTSVVYRAFDWLTRELFHFHLDSVSDWLRRFDIYFSRIKVYPLLQEPRRDIIVYGYFQDTTFLPAVRNEIVENVILSRQELGEEAKCIQRQIENSSHAIAISIRCLDGYANALFHVYKPEYYKLGMKYFDDKYPAAKYFVFADDIEKVRSEFGFPTNKCVFITSCSACEQLTLMSKCDDFIIANSSFSWWGAYLSNSNEKRIIAPEVWWNGIGIKEFGLFTEDMILMNDKVIE